MLLGKFLCHHAQIREEKKWNNQVPMQSLEILLLSVGFIFSPHVCDATSWADAKGYF